MPKWDGYQVETIDETVKYWAEQDESTMTKIMHNGVKKRKRWINVATGIITEPGTVFEPGCADGLVSECIPDGCDFYGVDVNEYYIAEGKKTHPEATLEVGDAFEVDEVYDWTIITNLFGMFPLEDTYRLMEKLWKQTRKGMAITTLDYYKYDNPRARKHRLTSHKPEELENRLGSLPGMGQIRMNKDMADGNLNRKFATYAYRDNYEGRKAFPVYK